MGAAAQWSVGGRTCLHQSTCGRPEAAHDPEDEFFAWDFGNQRKGDRSNRELMTRPKGIGAVTSRPYRTSPTALTEVTLVFISARTLRTGG
jgi:hypothetical protein